MTFRSAIITAAGSGSRLGQSIPKALVPIHGVPMLVRAIWPFAECDEIIVTCPPDHRSDFESVLHAHGLLHVNVVDGGSTRALSVAAGLHAVNPLADVVLIHDAARPFLPREVLQRVLSTLAAGHSAVVPVVPVTDSLKQVHADEVAEHSNRETFVSAQTPQGFAASAIRTAYSAAQTAGTLATATDDVTIAGAAGFAVVTVSGDPRNVKVTVPADLPQGGTAPALLRAGFATDAHAFSAGGELALAGVTWPEHPALAGHSDGDAAIHALCDALLSAAGLGDLGAVFGTEEAQWAGAASIRLLEHTIAVLADAGWSCVSAQVQIIGNKPRFAPRREQAQALLASVVGVPVFISATTTDGLGFTGRGEGIAATASVLVSKEQQS